MLRFAPQPFERIVTAGLRGKDVHDEVRIVAQNPFAGLITFDRMRTPSIGAHGVLDRVGDRLVLAHVLAVTDDEVVGERRDAAQIQYPDILGLLLLGRPDGDKPGFRVCAWNFFQFFLYVVFLRCCFQCGVLQLLSYYVKA